MDPALRKILSWVATHGCCRSDNLLQLNEQTRELIDTSCGPEQRCVACSAFDRLQAAGIEEEPSCIICGCTESNACQPNGCSWD